MIKNPQDLYMLPICTCSCPFIPLVLKVRTNVPVWNKCELQSYKCCENECCIRNTGRVTVETPLSSRQENEKQMYFGIHWHFSFEINEKNIQTNTSKSSFCCTKTDVFTCKLLECNEQNKQEAYPWSLFFKNTLMFSWASSASVCTIAGSRFCRIPVCVNINRKPVK